MTKRILTAVIVLLSMVGYAASQSRAGGFKDWNPRETLTGLGEIGLIIKYGQPDPVEEGGQASILQRLRDRAEIRLRQGGVWLSQSTDEAELNAESHLIVTITLKKPSDNPPALLVESKLFQRVRLWRDPAKEMELATWSMSVVGANQEEKMLFMLFDKLCDSFVSEYRAANPNPQRVESRKSGTPAQPNTNANALQGMTGVSFTFSPAFIQLVDAHLKAFSDTLHDEATNKLTRAGIPLLYNASDVARAGYPLLSVQVTLDENRVSYGPAIDVRTEVWQRVCRFQDPRKYTYVVTWESHDRGGLPVTEEALRRIVLGQLDQFVQAYKAANQK